MEDNILEIVIPMDSVANLQAGQEVNKRVNEKVNDNVNETEKNLLALLIENPKCTMTQLAEISEVSRKTIAARLKTNSNDCSG